MELIVCSDHAFDLVTVTTEIEPHDDGRCEFCVMEEIRLKWLRRIPMGS